MFRSQRAVALLLLAFAIEAWSQTVPPPATTTASSASDKAPALKIVGVLPAPNGPTASPNSLAPAKSVKPQASLGDSIVLNASNELADWLDYAARHKKTVTLFVDGNDTGLEPEAIDRSGKTLRFHLERNASNKSVWSALLRDPFQHQTRTVDASVGFKGEGAVPTEGSTSFDLIVVHWAWYAWAWLVLLLAALGVFVWLVAKRDLLRDGPYPNPYSLGRSQMAWWFFLIIVSYVLIWLISGDQDTITPSLLGLMGISAATALGAALIDNAGTGSGALSQAATDRLALQAAQQNASQKVNDAQATAAAAPTDPVAQKVVADAQAALAVVNAKLAEVNNKINGIAAVPQTRGFFRDILSDSNGTAGLHRFQIFVWTIVLGIIFLVSVVTELSMPQFSPTLLATMGISAGTYLGFKFPEK